MSNSKGADIRARLRPFGIAFEQSLTDLIRGIRANKDPEQQAKFLSNAIEECRKEVRSSDMDLKTTAVLKLAYLEMYGFDMSWANFHVLEVMSSSKFQQKRVGYLAAIQSFRNDNDVLMLTTNLLKKDLNSSKTTETGVALSGISTVVSTALASDITDDIIKMLNHSKPYIRKKAVLAMYKIFLKYPDALRIHLDRLASKLDDDDDTVVTATVTVICELSKKTPTLLVNLVPQLYHLLNTSSNNWMLIRLLKLFASLTKVEPRLKGKLLDPILEFMSNTKASSLVYECVNCLVSGDMIEEDDYQIAKACLDELIEFFKHDDSNLKYVGLLAFYKIGKINSAFITGYREIILEFLEDNDVTIREKALDLVHGIVDEDNLFNVVKLLMIQLVPKDDEEEEKEETEEVQQLDKLQQLLKKQQKVEIVLSEEYKTNIIKKILEISSFNNYTNIPSFDWYLAVISDLIDLSLANNLKTGDLLGIQLRDIAIRVPSIRQDVISSSIKYLNNEKIFEKLSPLLTEIFWIVGEYSNSIKNGNDLIKSLIEGSSELKLLKLKPEILVIFIPTVIKIYSNFINRDLNWDLFKKNEIIELTNLVLKFLNKLSNSRYFEIQERSTEFSEFLKLILESIDAHDDAAIEPPLLLTTALPSLFNSWELNPISAGSQLRVPIPEDLDLETVIHEEIFNDIENSEDEEDEIQEFEEKLYEDHGIEDDSQENDAEYSLELENRKRERQEKLKDDPYYLSNDSASQILPRNKSSDGSSRIFTPRSATPTTIQIDEALESKKSKRKKKEKVLIISDEVLDNGSIHTIPNVQSTKSTNSVNRKKKLLTIDSSKLDNFDINKPVEQDDDGAYEIAKLREELNASSLKEETPEQEDGVVVVRKKKKKSKKVDADGNVIEKKKKKKKKTEENA